MTKSLSAALIASAIVASGLTAVPAAAHGNVSCNVPRNERQPSVRLQKQLKEAGWKVKKIQVYYGCYEVYGTDANGQKVEAFFDPRTLERMKVEA